MITKFKVGNKYAYDKTWDQNANEYLSSGTYSYAGFIHDYETGQTFVYLYDENNSYQKRWAVSVASITIPDTDEIPGNCTCSTVVLMANGCICGGK